MMKLCRQETSNQRWKRLEASTRKISLPQEKRLDSIFLDFNTFYENTMLEKYSLLMAETLLKTACLLKILPRES